jgi:tRNA threonylcarbamoyl adenosine modification protein YeaZ
LLCADGKTAVAQQQVTTHSESLLAMVEDCLRRQGIAAQDLSGIGCSAGPGSFTGLRIGLATAKGLCFALNRPLALVSSLEALGGAIAEQQQQAATLVVLDAFRGQLFARLLPPRHALATPAPLAPLRALYAAEPRLGHDSMWSPAELRQVLQRLKLPWLLCAPSPLPPAAHALAESAQAVVGDADRGEGQRFEVAPVTLARQARARFLAGDHADLFAAVPNYLCGSAPEEAERQRVAEHQRVAELAP